MSFPVTRMRRLRKSPVMRKMVSGINLAPSDFIYPLFVVEGKGIKNEVSSMPGVYQMSLDNLVLAAEEAVEKGIKSIILFGIPEKKDSQGTEAYREDGIIQRTLKVLKKEFPDLLLTTDVCLCEYTDHGHCGIVQDGSILNDSTLDLLAKTAVSHAYAGADIVAPSDMMDGRVGVIRKALDEVGFLDTAIMAYSVKYSSAFYGPFRDAAESAPQFGDRSTYQMDIGASSEQALKEALLDIEEGADIVMVKPAQAYLDIIKVIKENVLCPVAAYCVSGEYSMIKAAALRGWIDEKQIVIETMKGIKRAGSDIIITYHAKDIVSWLKENPYI